MKKFTLFLIIGIFLIVSHTKAATYLDNSSPSNYQYYTDGFQFFGGAPPVPTMGNPTLGSATTTTYVVFASLTAINLPGGDTCTGFQVRESASSDFSNEIDNQGTNEQFISSSSIALATSTQVVYFYDFQVTMTINTSHYYAYDVYNCQNPYPTYLHSINGWTNPGYNVLNGISWGYISDSTSTPSGESAPNLYFDFPHDGSTTPIFDNAIIKATGLNSSTIYTVQVGQREGTLFWGTWYNQWTGGSGHDLIIHGRGIPFIGDLGCGSVSNTSFPFEMYAEAWVSSDTTMTIVASTTISFNQLPTCGVNGTTTVLYNSITTGQANATTTVPITQGTTTIDVAGLIGQHTNTTSSLCGQQPAWTDVGGGIQYGACVILFATPTPIQTAFNDQISQVQTKFPISAVVGLFNAASSSLNSSTTPLYTTLPMTIPSAMGQNTTTIDLLPSNLWTADPQAEQVKETIWPLVVNFLWLSTAGGVIAILAT